MMNLSFLSKKSSLDKIQLANIVSIVLFFISFISGIVFYGYNPIMIISFANFILAWIIFVQVRRVRSNVRQITDVIEKASAGDLEQRVVLFKDQGVLRVLVDDLNYFIDQVDAFLREIQIPIEKASQGIFDRPVVTRGFKGVFKQNAEKINIPLQEMKANQLFMERITINNELSKLGGGIMHGLMIIKEDLNKANTKADDIRQASLETESIAQKSVSDLSKIVLKIDDLTHNIEDSNKVIQELETQTNNINSVINLIKEIAEQTNLLSLNAAIEAARAGEHGRGFAVVADEVRSLSQKTQQAADEVTQSIGTLQQKSKSTYQQSEQMTKTAVEVRTFIQGFGQVLEQMNGNAEKTNRYALSVYNTLFITLIKLNHILIKNRAYSSVFHGHADGEIISHTACDFGQWYYGEKEEGMDLRSLPSFSQIETPHKKLHECLIHAIQLLPAENTPEEQASAYLAKHKEILLKDFECAEANSEELFKRLNELINEYERTLFSK